MLLAHHRDFLTSVRKIQQTESGGHQGFSAAANKEIMALDHISIGPDFVAVAGVFSDHAFLEYLYQQASIDYVEQNQVFKSTHVRPTKEDLFVIHVKRDGNDDDEEEEEPSAMRKDANDMRQIKTASSANWGLARINQHERGDLDEYEYDAMGG
jgi:hypothetical protein